MTKNQIIKKVNSFPVGASGPRPRIVIDEDFREAFIKSVFAHGSNGYQVHHDLGFDYSVSKELIDKYLRILFGSYKKIGRPLDTDKRS